MDDENESGIREITMTYQFISQIAIYVIGGLGIFLLGMKQMSEGMQAVAGERMRKLINMVTNNRITACLVGVSITGLIQSSSVTTVMVVGMVNAGLMTLRQATGVIMGTNIGTTVTAWIVALNLLDYGLPMIGLSVFFYLFAKNEKVRYNAMVILGIGMIFFGLQLMKTGLEPLKGLPSFVNFMAAFQPTNLFGVLKCVFAGAFVTAIIQSSSATVAITITLATTGIITFETAVALVLGENIGTTVTAFLASIGTNTTARRAAYAHIFFNIIGVIIMVPLFKYYIWFLEAVVPAQLNVAERIAFTHTFFNCFIVILLLPLIDPYTRLVEWIVPGKKTREKSHLTYLDIRLYETPAFAIQQSYREIVLMSENTREMMAWLKTVIMEKDQQKFTEDKLFHREKTFDIIQKEIVEFIGNMMTGTLSHDITSEARIHLRMADEYESVSDNIVSILKLRCRMRNTNLSFNEKGKQELLDLHDALDHFFLLIEQALKARSKDALAEHLSSAERITHRVKDIRANHLERLEKNETSPLFSLVFLDILNTYRRIKDHGVNIAEALAGEK
jgi:phosphate:Na+ symporter